MKYGILIHESQDDVGVAVMDLTAGSEIGTATLEGEPLETILVAEDIPLGHKVAMHEIQKDQHIIEYGRAIGTAKNKIQKGAHVHVHNLNTLRWS